MGAFLFTSALRDFLRPTRVAVWLLVAIAIGTMSYVLTTTMVTRDPVYQYGQLSGAFTFHVVALAAAIFATNIISAEVEQKTIVYLLTRPIPRWKIILFRMLAAAVATFLVAVCTMVAVSIAVRDVGPFHSMVRRDFLALIFGTLAYTALFTFVTLILNKPMVACMLFAFGWEVAVPNMPGSTFYLSINTYMSGIAAHPETELRRSVMRVLAGQNSAQVVAAGTSIIVLSILVVALTALATQWFSRFEYVPREDTE